MLMTYDKTSKLINDGKLLHIAGTEELLRKLPKGSWIGGSTEYFMTNEGGRITGELLFVTEFSYEIFSVKAYEVSNIEQVAQDAFNNGFSIVIVPFDSAIHKEYAQNASGYKDMFIKNITGWVSGINLLNPEQVPVVVNGATGMVYTDRAAVLHLGIPNGKEVSINIINIFEQDKSSPVIEFTHEGFSVASCLVDGKETVFADYLAQQGIDVKLPFVGNYSGNGINISIKSIESGVVNLYAPVFPGIKYRMAKSILDFEHEFNSRLTEYDNTNVVFSCNCILNFLYGGFEDKSIKGFTGPITFGEIAYQLVNQTLVYVTEGEGQ